MKGLLGCPLLYFAIALWNADFKFVACELFLFACMAWGCMCYCVYLARQDAIDAAESRKKWDGLRMVAEARQMREESNKASAAKELMAAQGKLACLATWTAWRVAQDQERSRGERGPT